MNNPNITLEIIQEQFQKFGVLNKEQQEWLMDTLKMYIGDDPQFLPVIICGVKQSSIQNAQGDLVQSTPVWHVLPTNMPGINISELLTTVAINIAFRLGISVGTKQNKEKSNIIKAN